MKNEKTLINNKKTSKINNDIVRSSVIEYLTYIGASGENGVNVIYQDENIWLTQKMMALLYTVGVNTINYHLKESYESLEIERNSTIRKFRIVQKEGNRDVERDIEFYNLKAIITVGYKVNSEKAISFRKWASKIIEEFTIKGFSMDDERLKNDGSILTKKYFEEQLARIREIRLSERKFYQKITDIFATSIDYDKKSKVTFDFFKKVQNKLHYAITSETAPEIIYKRADADKENMGLTTWKDSPNGKILSTDVVIAKNYLTEEEIKSLGLIVSAYLDLSEENANRHIPMTMNDWINILDDLLKLTRREILENAGSITHEIAEKHALSEFEKYRILQDDLFKSDYDIFLEESDNEEYNC